VTWVVVSSVVCVCYNTTTGKKCHGGVPLALAFGAARPELRDWRLAALGFHKQKIIFFSFHSPTGKKAPMGFHKQKIIFFSFHSPTGKKAPMGFQGWPGGSPSLLTLEQRHGFFPSDHKPKIIFFGSQTKNYLFFFPFTHWKKGTHGISRLAWRIIAHRYLMHAAADGAPPCAAAP
jgi:hypothetical protein